MKYEVESTKLEVRSLFDSVIFPSTEAEVLEAEGRGWKYEVRSLFDSVIFPRTESEVLEAEGRSTKFIRFSHFSVYGG